jgi:hypothetical protein
LVARLLLLSILMSRQKTMLIADPPRPDFSAFHRQPQIETRLRLTTRFDPWFTPLRIYASLYAKACRRARSLFHTREWIRRTVFLDAPRPQKLISTQVLSSRMNNFIVPGFSKPKMAFCSERFAFAACRKTKSANGFSSWDSPIFSSFAYV